MISDRSWADALYISSTPISDVGLPTAGILDHPLFPAGTSYPSWPDPALPEPDHTESASPAYVPEVHLDATHQLLPEDCGTEAHLINLPKSI